jgi:hypothetical protein
VQQLSWYSTHALAACIVLLAGIAFAYAYLHGGGGGGGGGEGGCVIRQNN